MLELEKLHSDREDGVFSNFGDRFAQHIEEWQRAMSRPEGRLLRVMVKHYVRYNKTASVSYTPLRAHAT